MNVRRFFSSAAALAPLLWSVGCRGDLAQPSTQILLRSVVADTSSSAILLAITPDAPSTIEVVYWTAGDSPLEYRTPEPVTNVTVPLSQLRPGRVYEYDARTVNSNGIPGPSMHGVVTAPSTSGKLMNLHFSATGYLSVPLVMLEVNTPSYSAFVAVNQYGEPVWHWDAPGNPQGFTQRANGNFVFLDGTYGLFEVTPAGNVVHQLSAHFNGNAVPHHDIVATPANTLLFIAHELKTVNGTLIIGEAIYEWTPETGDVVKRWNSFDFYDPNVDVGPRSSSSDWLHANSLALGDHGNVILSLNWLSQVISIAPNWQTIEWRMGGAKSTIAMDSAATFQGQHTAAVLENGHMLVFDNGRDRIGTARNSRAAEIAFTPGGSAHLVWSFTPSATQYDPYVGAARRLENGNTLVFFGMRDGFAGATGPMAAYEVRPNGVAAWRLTYDGGDINYRATPLGSISGEAVVNDSRFALHAR